MRIEGRKHFQFLFFEPTPRVKKIVPETDKLLKANQSTYLSRHGNQCWEAIFCFFVDGDLASVLICGRVIGSTSSMSLSTNLTYVHIHQPDILASRPNNSYCRYHPTQFFWWPPYFSLLVFHLFFSSLFSHGFFICLLSRPLCYEKSPSVTHQAWELFSSW